MAGMLILKQMIHKSNEVIAEECRQNPYYQYFTGVIYFEWELPCDPSDLVHFRKRIGEKGVLKIFALSLELHKEKIKQAHEVVTDTAVQEADECNTCQYSIQSYESIEQNQSFCHFI